MARAYHYDELLKKIDFLNEKLLQFHETIHSAIVVKARLEKDLAGYKEALVAEKAKNAQVVSGD
jgi:uncharacterized coiled-coil DUF342 family protein